MRKSKFFRALAAFMALNITLQQVAPMTAWALTSGPSQPEVQAFQPYGTNDMVNLFTGDFSYNIPLFELPGPDGGYPFNLSYSAGIGMDQEASWVGLGWNLNPGTITRTVRGVPDEFDGRYDQFGIQTDMKPNYTVTGKLTAGTEILGFDGEKIKLLKKSPIKSLGLSVYYNSYRGMGGSLDLSGGTNLTLGNGLIGIKPGLGLSLNMNGSVSVQPNLSVGLTGSKMMANLTYGASYNSLMGLQNHSVGYSVSRQSKYTKKGSDKNTNVTARLGSSLNFATNTAVPPVGVPMTNKSISIAAKIGLASSGLFSSVGIEGIFNTETPRSTSVEKVPAYGYMNLHNAPDNSEASLDFTREKDGMITEDSKNLAVSYLTPDIYSVSGQGISGSFRPFRSDIGTVGDPKSISKATGGNVGVEIGTGAGWHGGLNLSVPLGESISQKWTWGKQEKKDQLSFRKEQPNSDFEPYYMKSHGEHTVSDYGFWAKIKEEKPVKASKLNSSSRGSALPGLSRDIRIQTVQTFTNKDLLDVENKEVLGFFKVWETGADGKKYVYRRKHASKPNHIAGFVATATNGTKYVYALPAYNLTQSEFVFSNTDAVSEDGTVTPSKNGDTPSHNDGTGYLNRKDTPAFPYAFHLTAVIGPGYTDITEDGPTEDDLGYWVSFSYRQTAQSFSWETPYGGKASKQLGLLSDENDDKAHYIQGTKEIWHLAEAQTRTHAANFVLEERKDARGSDIDRDKSYRLKSATLSVKGSDVPLKKVHFEHDYALCPNTPNSVAPGQKKLTLKSLSFSFGNSKKGKLNPYRFDYQNPEEPYKHASSDRWGNLKRYTSGGSSSKTEKYQFFPYVDQQEKESKELYDQRMGTWSLNRITMPSGSVMHIDYEGDDYAYVQHRKAMAMARFVTQDTKPATSGTQLQKSGLKIKFPIPTDLLEKLREEFSNDDEKIVSEYLGGENRKVLIKSKVALKPGSGSGKHKWEYIDTYADVESCGIEPSSDSETAYGYCVLKDVNGFNPISYEALQFIRFNRPELLTQDVFTPEYGSDMDQANAISILRNIASVGSFISSFFVEYHKHRFSRNWGRTIDLENSVIRIAKMDGVKRGGGLRVKQITLKDTWVGDNKTNLYGQVYGYRTKNKFGREISSGVASYEPTMGGDENPLRYIKEYRVDIPLAVDRIARSEYPFNEGLFPGGQIGYSKVTVMSLASAYLNEQGAKGKLERRDELDDYFGNASEFGTTGKTVHTFYTAKEFPVFTDQTVWESSDRKTRFGYLPLIGTKSMSTLKAFQGYSITTNDMHGKPRKQEQYRQSTDGTFEQNPYSWTESLYAMDATVLDGVKVYVPVNKFYKGLSQTNDADKMIALDKDEAFQGNATTVLFGQTVEMLVDRRKHTDKHQSFSASPNLDFASFWPLLSIIPEWSKTRNSLYTESTNKIIHKAGIPIGNIAYQDGSEIRTRHIKWDMLTGKPILSAFNNAFGETTYAYNKPAYYDYKSMGPAYQNEGLSFTASVLNEGEKNTVAYSLELTPGTTRFLTEGDELILSKKGEGRPITRAIVLNTSYNQARIAIPKPLMLSKGESLNALVFFSGHKNMLDAVSETITALTEDPTRNSTEITTVSDTEEVPEFN
ncbi:hypothetical protein FUAX_53220 (plasmid) [Fulvitalea axinellae]|uniref:Cell surface protein SprA n=1 Tax=Fulvitalea axinellae TaxID=1182444 RepID=A0AAU9CV09_9BACT|nr:hypothetical protein FUAX_53220 [Fulvitalea axinellae]